MPLTGTGPAWGDAVVTALQGVDPTMTPDQIAQLKTSWEAICTVMANWIVANASVVVTSVSGVQMGGGTSGPGTGTVS